MPLMCIQQYCDAQEFWQSRCLGLNITLTDPEVARLKGMSPYVSNDVAKGGSISQRHIHLILVCRTFSPIPHSN